MNRNFFDYDSVPHQDVSADPLQQPSDPRSQSPTRSRDFGASLSVPRLPTEIESASRRRQEEVRYARPPQAQGTRLSLSSCKYTFQVEFLHADILAFYFSPLT